MHLRRPRRVTPVLLCLLRRVLFALQGIDTSALKLTISSFPLPLLCCCRCYAVAAATAVAAAAAAVASVAAANSDL